MTLQKQHGGLGIPNIADMNLCQLPRLRDISWMKARFGSKSLMANIKLIALTFLLALAMVLPPFGNGSFGLLKPLVWDIPGQLEMAIVLDSGKTNGLGIPP